MPWILSTDLSGGCVGLVIGFFANAEAQVAVDWFDYRGWRTQQESGLTF